MKLYIQNHGHFENDASLNLAGATMATVDNKEVCSQWVTNIPSLTLLIEHEDVGWILFDTTSRPDNLDGHWPERLRKVCPHYLEPEDALQAKLGLLGLKPEDIDVLVLSHLHIDHAGNLNLFSGTKAGREVIVHETELKEALYLTHLGPDRNWGAYVRDDFVVDGIAYRPVSQDFELAKGVEIITLEGDAPGILGLVLHLDNAGTIIYPSDAIKTKANYGPPPVPAGVVYDSLGFLRSVEKVRNLQQRYDATILFAHDGDDLENFKLSPEYYD
jgi:glyoxylase-like metal-dependent hydrolase (beta-lactamase superfamily II)